MPTTESNNQQAEMGSVVSTDEVKNREQTIFTKPIFIVIFTCFLILVGVGGFVYERIINTTSLGQTPITSTPTSTDLKNYTNNDFGIGFSYSQEYGTIQETQGAIKLVAGLHTPFEIQRIKTTESITNWWNNGAHVYDSTGKDSGETMTFPGAHWTISHATFNNYPAIYYVLQATSEQLPNNFYAIQVIGGNISPAIYTIYYDSSLNGKDAQIISGILKSFKFTNPKVALSAN